MNQAVANAGHGAGGAIVQEAIADIGHIATLPEVTFRIIRLVEDPNSTAQDMNQVISHDPALGARILKVVNSAFYGLPGQIGSINRAIVLLGMNAVKNIAIAASLSKLFRGGQVCRTFNARDLWLHSMAVATGTKLLAAEAKLAMPDEAFLAGLMHDVGIMVEIQARRMMFIQAMEGLDVNPRLSFRQAERVVFGADHQQFGAELCRTWKFPPAFAAVAGSHHRPLDLPEEQRPLTCLVHVADVIAATRAIGYVRTVETHDFHPEVLQVLQLNRTVVDEIGDRLPQAMEEAMTLLQE